MRVISTRECDMVAAGGVSGETIGCAVGGYVGGAVGGGIGGLAGCIVGAAIANGNYSAGSVNVNNPGWARAFVEWLHK